MYPKHICLFTGGRPFNCIGNFSLTLRLDWPQTGHNSGLKGKFRKSLSDFVAISQGFPSRLLLISIAVDHSGLGHPLERTRNLKLMGFGRPCELGTLTEIPAFGVAFRFLIQGLLSRIYPCHQL